jgi:GTP-binding protein Era
LVFNSYHDYLMQAFQSGFVSIFGKPNAGKSTLLNKLVGEKMAIVSHKVQTTRHRIKAFLNTDQYQIIFSDTPGIIDPQYKLHQKMMQQVKNALEDADVAVLLYDAKDQNLEETHEIFNALKLRVPAIVIINKTDVAPPERVEAAQKFFGEQSYAKEVLAISAKRELQTDQLVPLILKYLPSAEPFYSTEDLSDLPTKFFVGELIREKIFELFHEELPYHTAVIVQEFKEKSTLIKIRAEIIVHRETQKYIIIGEGGKMIKKLGTESREGIEKFLGQKVFLELFVKVKPKWRDDELKLREYGY